MANRTSAAALYAARTVQQFFAFTVIPPEEVRSGKLVGLQVSDRCIAILIDYATNIFEIAALRPKLRYWQEHLHAGTAEAPQIAFFLRELLDAFDKIPKFSATEKPFVTTISTPPQFESGPIVHELSKASLEASRFLFAYYRITPLKGIANNALDRVRIATLVEGSLGLSRASRALPLLKWVQEELSAGAITEQEIKKQFRIVGILLEHLPNYAEREEEVKLL